MAGEDWARAEPGISPRPMYFSDIRVDPLNENRVYRVGNEIDVSEDQGRTFRTTVQSDIIHGDIHDLWINPRDPRAWVALAKDKTIANGIVAGGTRK